LLIFGFNQLASTIDHAIVLRDEDGSMTRTTLSPKFQIVIPKDVRKALKLRPGIQFNVIEHEGRIELLPVRSPKQMRGFLRGIDTSVPRENDRV
jgi:AbrB family looped-hinge helix DNA binding protein